MKDLSRSIIIALFILIVSSCVEGKKEQSVKIDTPEEIKEEKKQTADIADTSFKDGMTGKVFHNYLQVRTALTNSDVSGAQEAAGNLAESFSEKRAAMKAKAEKIADTDDLERQRKLFSEFTDQIEPLFKEGLASGTIYKLHCPMAFNSEGASWFSEVAEIKNPYFGVKMLNCGSVTETIEQN